MNLSTVYYFKQGWGKSQPFKTKKKFLLQTNPKDYEGRR
jgi:hypothetical protein